MRQLADYHMHTPLCRHATGEPVEYAARAVLLGLEEIGFSDHAPMREDGFDAWRMDLGDLDGYVAAVERARRAHPGLSIRLGLEVDYLPGQEAWIGELARRHPWDYFIGSVHYLGDWDIDNPNKVAEWQRRVVRDVWVAYVDRLTEAARTGLFDIMGHIDLPKKFGHYPEGSVLADYERFLGVAREAGVAIELNTAGLRKDCREIYPSRGILEAAFRCGVPITFGSDAHAPGEVGSAWAEAWALAWSVGYRSCRRYAGRKYTEAALAAPTSAVI